jgi:FkbM family methyltransferase
MLHEFLRQVQSAGLAINTVYDVGAWDGNWSRITKSNAIPNANFVLFEANPVYKEGLESTGFTSFCGMALSNPGRTSVEFYNGTNTGDSYYKETTKFYDDQGTITLPCTTLDVLKQSANLPTPQFIKIDTQGSELDILSGADSFIKDVDLIYTECPIVRYNAGAPDIQDYLDFFKQREFIPIDVFEIHRGEATLIQIDIMFMKKESKERIFGPNNFIRPFA